MPTTLEEEEDEPPSMPLTLGDAVIGWGLSQDRPDPILVAPTTTQSVETPVETPAPPIAVTTSITTSTPVKTEVEEPIVVSSSDEGGEASRAIKIKKETPPPRKSQRRRDMILLSLHLSQTMAQAAEGCPLSAAEQRHRAYLMGRGLLPSELSSAATPHEQSLRLTAFYEGMLQGADEVDD